MIAEADDVGGTGGPGSGGEPGRDARAGFEHERSQAPSRGRVVWSRSLLVLIIGFVLASTPWGLLRDGVGVWSYVLSVAALACLLPLAISAWARATRPYPHDRTWLVLSRGLTGPQRKSVDRTLRRGAVEEISFEHRPYARAQTARSSRDMVGFPFFIGLLWGQTLSSASREVGSGFFWLILVGTVLATTFGYSMIVQQRRRERTVARLDREI